MLEDYFDKTVFHLQLLRGDGEVIGDYVGRDGEITVNKTDKHIYLHDNATSGGTKVAMFYDIPTKISAFENDSLYAKGDEQGRALQAVEDGNGNNIADHYARKDQPSEFKTDVTVPTVDSTGEENYSDNTSSIPENELKQAVNIEYLTKCKFIVRTYGAQTIYGSKTFNETINGMALRAQWADLAEFYESDKQYAPGTLICFGGEREITEAIEHANGVVSENPALLINSKLATSNALPVALCGRVPVRVKGKVKKFDRLVLSEVHGVAKADNDEKDLTKIIGKALESTDNEGISLIESVISFNIF